MCWIMIFSVIFGFFGGRLLCIRLVRFVLFILISIRLIGSLSVVWVCMFFGVRCWSMIMVLVC